MGPGRGGENTYNLIPVPEVEKRSGHIHFDLLIVIEILVDPANLAMTTRGQYI